MPCASGNLLLGELESRKRPPATANTIRDTPWDAELHVTHPSYGLSSPVVTNINGDFALDTFLTTTSGKIYGFGEGGNVLPGWPVQMSSIVASCVAEDVDGDGQIEICAADVRGTVACFASNGRLKWETHVAGGVVETPTLGDVNGDGVLDLVVGTSAGAIYALNGKTGAVLENFPILAGGPVVAPALLLNLNLTAPPALPSAAKGLHLVVPSMDGILYVISGTTGCYEAIDIGEKSTTMVLAEDLTGNGLVDLVVTTMSGSVLVYSTETPFHPLKAWTSRTKMLSSVTASEGYVGVFIEPESRTPRDIRGDRFQLLVTIRDERPNPHPNIPRRYTLTVLIGTRIIVFSGMFFEAKTYPLALHAPLQRMYATVRVVLSLPNGQHFKDSTSFGFNMHFLETIKYVLLVPFVLFVVAMSLVKKEHGVTMMSHNNSRGSQQQQQYQRSRRYYEEESIL